MRAMSRMIVVVLMSAAMLMAFADAPEQGQEQQPQQAQQGPRARPVFDLSAFRPQIVLHEMSLVTDTAFVTVTGVVFSRTPIEKVTVGERSASTRMAEPKDLVRLTKVPAGASDAPYRTYFEVPDAGLPKLGANDLEVVAYGVDGRVSDAHRATIVRSMSAPK